MCNLYTTKLSREEIRGLFRHRELIGRNYRDVMQVYPNGEAPVLLLDASGAVDMTDMRWGFPRPPNVPGGGYVTNVRNTSSNFWKPRLKAPNVEVGKAPMKR